MKDYCALHIRSDTKSELPRNFLERKLEIIFTDNESPERIASFDRLAAKGVFKRKDLPRYHWVFSSEGAVDGFDVYKHISWVLDQINPEFSLTRLRNLGFEFLLQFYWESNGTGGGPLITSELAELLVQHNVNLQFGFYSSMGENF
ncbi:hypothetical protein ABE501_00890 [Comamonas testosteroni]